MALLHPETNLAMSIITLGSHILNDLQNKNEPILVDTLLEKHLKRNKYCTIVNFLSTLEFLYSLGVIEQNGYKIRLITHSNQLDMIELPHMENNHA